MGIRNTDERYGWLAKLFHWVVALLIITLLVVGTFMTGMPNNPDKFKVYSIHKSIGIIVLTLASLRLLWALFSVKPEDPEDMPMLQKLAAMLSHCALYALMFFIPVTGWMMSNAAGYEVSVFGLAIPNIVNKSEELQVLTAQMHYVSTTIIMFVIGLHVIAALFHHFIQGDNILTRMLPGKDPRVKEMPMPEFKDLGPLE